MVAVVVAAVVVTMVALVIDDNGVDVVVAVVGSPDTVIVSCVTDVVVNDAVDVDPSGVAVVARVVVDVMVAVDDAGFEQDPEKGFRDSVTFPKVARQVAIPHVPAPVPQLTVADETLEFANCTGIAAAVMRVKLGLKRRSLCNRAIAQSCDQNRSEMTVDKQLAELGQCTEGVSGDQRE
eukprot:m.178830 g.178830  ORF g.178830 m.178830 type:complete len:179 (-) comp53405_c0_seq1:142-678(-)